MTRIRLFSICVLAMFALVPQVAGQAPPRKLQLKCDRNGLFFQWRAVERAQHYRYQLIAEDGERLIRSRTKETSVDLGAGEPGQTYTARVRVKRKNNLSKWASVTAKCPAAAPAPSISFDFYYISRDAVIFDFSWKNLPAAARSIYIRVSPEDNDCDHRMEHYLAFEAGERNFNYAGLCPNTSHHVEFIIVDKSGYVHLLKEVHFRTLP